MPYNCQCQLQCIYVYGKATKGFNSYVNNEYNTFFFPFSFVFQADREHPFSQEQLMDQEQGWRKRQYEMGEGRVVEGLTVDKMARDSGVASDVPPDVGNAI